VTGENELTIDLLFIVKENEDGKESQNQEVGQDKESPNGGGEWDIQEFH